MPEKILEGPPAIASNKFRVVQQVNDHSVIYLPKSSLALLQLHRGDTVIVRKRRRNTLLIVLHDDKLEEGCAIISSMVKYNLCIRDGDSITVTADPTIGYAKRVALYPVVNTTHGVIGSLFDVCLKPYFREAYRPVVRGDYLSCRAGDKEVWFKIVEVDPPDRGIVSGETVIHSEGDHVECEEPHNLDRPGYDEIGGYNKELSELRKLVEVPIFMPDLFRSQGIQSARGILISGPTGVGKTYMIRALADETGAFFFHSSAAELTQMSADAAYEAMEKMFAEVKQKAPAILCIENIDKLGDASQGIIATLTRHLDWMGTNSRVFVIGTANNLREVMTRLRVHGRFDTTIELGVPNQADRLEILKIRTRSMNLDSDVSLDQIASTTDGFLASDLASLCSKASRRVVSRNSTILNHFEDDTVANKSRQSFVVSQNDFQLSLESISPAVIRTFRNLGL